MEKSIDYFNDIIEKMLLLDYDIFRISLIMYRNFDFSNFKESSVQLTKMLYKNHGEAIDVMTNELSNKELKWRKKYPINQLWDEIILSSSSAWVMEFASFL